MQVNRDVYFAVREVSSRHLRFTNLHHAWLKLCRVERQMTRKGAVGWGVKKRESCNIFSFFILSHAHLWSKLVVYMSSNASSKSDRLSTSFVSCTIMKKKNINTRKFHQRCEKTFGIINVFNIWKHMWHHASKVVTYESKTANMAMGLQPGISFDLVSTDLNTI